MSKKDSDSRMKRLAISLYLLSAILILIHLKKTRNADYIVALGSGIIGKKATPLLSEN